MKAIILAAGMGNRLMHLTLDKPKCMIEIDGKPLIERQLDIFRELSINDITIVKGFLKDKINYSDVKYCINDDYMNNNVLSSLFYAESELEGDVIITYADIAYSKSIIERLLQSQGDISLVVDTAWEKTHKSFPDMEKAQIRESSITKIGKNISKEVTSAEFTGIAKLSKRGTDILKKFFREACMQGTVNSVPVNTAYLSDLLQEIISKGYSIEPVAIEGGWVEIDTLQDLKKAGQEISLTKVTPEHRRGSLKRLLNEKGFARVIEVHSGISAIIANNSVNNRKESFDALWVSSLTESAAKGQPDIEIMGPDSRIGTVHQVIEVSNKPIIVDGDTGGDPNAFEYFIRKAESLGVSAVIIEDKVYPKRNSLDSESEQVLEDPAVFANKIMRGKDSLLTEEFMIIARIESFIAGNDIEDAISRARIYLNAGVDGIMIHSKSKGPSEVLEFAHRYEELCNELGFRKPLICVPTTYNTIKEDDLKASGFNVVIHANHSLRASIKAMQTVCKSILDNKRSKEAEEHCCTVEEIFDIVGFSDIKNREKKLKIVR